MYTSNQSCFSEKIGPSKTDRWRVISNVTTILNVQTLTKKTQKAIPQQFSDRARFLPRVTIAWLIFLPGRLSTIGVPSGQLLEIWRCGSHFMGIKRMKCFNQTNSYKFHLSAHLPVHYDHDQIFRGIAKKSPTPRIQPFNTAYFPRTMAAIPGQITSSPIFFLTRASSKKIRGKGRPAKSHHSTVRWI